MLDDFLRTLGTVGIFMICARMIVHFRPKETDEKYMKLLVSIMVLLQLLLPFGKQHSNPVNIPQMSWEEILSTIEESTKEIEDGSEQSPITPVEEISVEPIEKISLGE